jgi:hypothetical protein
MPLVCVGDGGSGGCGWLCSRLAQGRSLTALRKHPRQAGCAVEPVSTRARHTRRHPRSNRQCSGVSADAQNNQGELVLISTTCEHSGKRVWCVVRRCVFGLDWLCHGWMASNGLPWGASAHGTSSGNGCAPWVCWASSNVPTTRWWHVAEWATSASTGCCGWGAASTPSGSCRRTAVDRASGQGRQAVLVSWSSLCVGHWHHVNVAVVRASLHTHTHMHPRWSLAHTHAHQQQQGRGCSGCPHCTSQAPQASALF